MPFHISSMLLLIFCSITLTDYFIFVTGYMPIDVSAFWGTKETKLSQRGYRRNGTLCEYLSLPLTVHADIYEYDKILAPQEDNYDTTRRVIEYLKTINLEKEYPQLWSWVRRLRNFISAAEAQSSTPRIPISTPKATMPTMSSTRSTPEPTTEPRTPFDLLQFWSGESFKIANEIENEKKINGENPDIDKKRLAKKGARRANTQQSSPIEASQEPKNLTHLKINAYTLKQDITEIMSTLEENITITQIGTTIEYNDIVLVKMSKKPYKYFRALTGENKYVDEETAKKIIVIVHGLSPMGFRYIPCLYKADSFAKLVKIYASYLNYFDIFLIPMGNPDGIADESLPVWNKNKSPQQSCPGVSVDRNFDVHWNRSSGSSCSQQFSGPRPFSERESRAVADLIHHYTHKIIAYIHVHGGTYNPEVFKGDAVLYPKGYSDEDDTSKYIDMEAEIDEAMTNAGFQVFGVTMTSISKWYGIVGGTSVDYATTVYGIPYGMEFVMQSYEHNYEDGPNVLADYVLTEVWKRLIDVIFTKIYKSTGKEVSAEFNTD